MLTNFSTIIGRKGEKSIHWHFSFKKRIRFTYILNLLGYVFRTQLMEFYFGRGKGSATTKQNISYICKGVKTLEVFFALPMKIWHVELSISINNIHFHDNGDYQGFCKLVCINIYAVQYSASNGLRLAIYDIPWIWQTCKLALNCCNWYHRGQDIPRKHRI